MGNLSNEQLDIAHYAYIEATRAGVDQEAFLALIDCESKFKIGAEGDYRIETDTYISKGILQFQKSTFYPYAEIYGIAPQYLNPYRQIDLALLMIKYDKKGAGHWWNCANRVGMITPKILVRS